VVAGPGAEPLRCNRQQVDVSVTLCDCVAVHRSGYWDAKPEQLERLRQLYMDVEDKIEVGARQAALRLRLGGVPQPSKPLAPNPAWFAELSRAVSTTHSTGKLDVPCDVPDVPTLMLPPLLCREWIHEADCCRPWAVRSLPVPL
jgi:hypothetical protein